MTSPTDFKNMFNRSAADHTTDFQKAMDASRAKPEQIREAHDRQVEKIRAREDITPQARQVAMARAHRDTAAKLEAAQQADRQKYETRRAQLEKRLFGSDTNVTGTEAINRRQAREMAANLTDPQEAQAAYSRALRDGDRDYARAIASHAADQAAVPSSVPHGRPSSTRTPQPPPATTPTSPSSAACRSPADTATPPTWHRPSRPSSDASAPTRSPCSPTAT